MSTLQRRINLFHYNIWRLERWTRYLVSGDGRLATIESKDGEELEDCVPFAVYTVDESMLPNYSGKHFSILMFLALLTIVNFCFSLFRVGFLDFWFWGMVASAILAFLISLYLTPIPLKVPVERNVLLDDFKTFEAMSKSEKRVSGLITFFIVIGIWAMSIFSFVYYLRSLTVSR